MSKESKLVFSSLPAFLAFGFGSGLSPKAPGTMGSLAALPILWFMQPFQMNVWFGAFILATFLFGIYICDLTSKNLGVHDHGGIVWDEFVGIWLTFWFIPLNITTIIIGFLLFRLFDIWKPFPISWLDKKVDGGLGIMVDDILAGIFSLITLHLIVNLLM